ncbi:MAG: histidinol phosphatase [Verrucomicrobiales bacterium]|nr:histidinol phosphatase [Verrucomicrobiales bacterium]MDP6677673.1 PHP domain-containing protein [Verrucomicrobiota bacterium]MDP6752153.1 PHP domain-containing protein [Verrucomicrobiota bacterium]MDP7014052.1 PHP domain-containing protein [Verrucomicrobiota bacterium]
MAKPYIDLHLHTHFSDGVSTPEQVAEEAERMELAAIALTDHDTIEGCPRLAKACATRGIEFIPGTELSTDIDGHEMHLLGYHLDTNNEELIRETTRYQQNRTDRVHGLIERLNSIDVPLTAEQVFALANCKAPGRPHVARALVKHGYCTTIDEAFARYLRKNAPGWVPKKNAPFEEAIQLIHHAGGLAVMAHPGLNKIDHLIPRMVDAGLDGLECWHNRHPKSTAKRYREMARRLGLLITGGSDCHGPQRGRYPLIGTVRVPSDVLDDMKHRLPSAVAPKTALGQLPLSAREWVGERENA